MLSPQAQALIAMIEEAFPLYPLPEVIKTPSLEGWPEEAAIDGLFTGRTWKEITLQYVLDTLDKTGPSDLWPADSLAFVTDEAHRYFLPAFLIMAITAHENKTRDYLIEDVMRWTFDTSKSNSMRFDCVARCTLAQKRAIARFLQYFRDIYARAGDKARLPEANEALQTYWGQFLTPESSSE